MTSNSPIKNADEAFVWIWLPQQSLPVVAGKLVKLDSRYVFVYGKKYRERADAISFSPFELPLTDEIFEPTGMNVMPCCLRDALPDAWGRRLIEYQYPRFPSELAYGLLSGSNRIGAFDFQSSANTYTTRELSEVTLQSLDQFAIALESNQRFSKALAPVLLHGTSVGGARPKCLIQIGRDDYIAKFSVSTDTFPFLRAEFLAMRLAKLIGIDVAEVKFTRFHGRDILLIKRFDRPVILKKKCRRIMLSGLSLLGLNEMEACYASYAALADLIRKHFIQPKKQLEELYKRLVFNVLIGNTDDHARNHSAFWDGHALQLTPAYDICPQLRTGFEASQAMMIEGEAGQRSTLNNVLSVCDRFLLSKDVAHKIMKHQIQILDKQWLSLCKTAQLHPQVRDRLYGSVIKSHFALTDWN